MSFAENMRATLARCRAIPGELGLRPHAVEIVTRSYSGAHTGDGDAAESAVQVLNVDQNPRCRWLTDEQRALGGLVKDAVDIGPITPGSIWSQWVDMNGSIETVDGTNTETGETLQLRITGPNHPNGALYRITRIQRDRAMRIVIRAEPVQ
jgi:hypothetical protein